MYDFLNPEPEYKSHAEINPTKADILVRLYHILDAFKDDTDTNQEIYLCNTETLTIFFDWVAKMQADTPQSIGIEITHRSISGMLESNANILVTPEQAHIAFTFTSFLWRYGDDLGELSKEEFYKAMHQLWPEVYK